MIKHILKNLIQAIKCKHKNGSNCLVDGGMDKKWICHDCGHRGKQR